MNDTYTIRKATVKDADFIAKVIIEAEKSMTKNNGLANYFEMPEYKVKECLIKILEEEIPGCELSIDSFIVACCNNRPVSAMGGWLEGYYDGMPSALIKSNLIGYHFPMENILKTKSKGELVRELHIERDMDTYQLEYSYTENEHRGHRLINKIMTEHLEYAKKLNINVKKAQLHVFENNPTIIKVHQRSGFKITKRVESSNPKVLEYFPYNVELLMEKEL